MKKIKIIIKIFAFILIIKASFLSAFAFIGDDLGLDLYKNIDKGVGKLNSQMYSHELKGGNTDGDITENINKKIKRAGLEGCELSNITEEDIQKIAFGEKDDVEKAPHIALLKQKIKGDKCDNSIETLNTLQLIIYNLSLQSTKTAKTKANEIYNISKVGLFSDGNIQNSPFDIVKDIKDIDYIIFTQEIDYSGDNNIDDNKLSDYLNGELDDFENKINEEITAAIKGDKEGKNNPNNPTKNGTTDKQDNNKELIKNIIDGSGAFLPVSGDITTYNCPTPEEDSGLSREDLAEIIKDNNKNLDNNNSSKGGKKGPLNSSYSGGKGLNDNFGFSTSGNYFIGGDFHSSIGNKQYEPVNDNDYFGGCKSFFCVNIDFLTHKSNLLIGGKTRSIESIMERSNNHLKKFANSSLIQSKMTTNNFELGLRDLNLSDIFSMPIVLIYKTPPILDLDFFNKKTKSKKKKEKNSNPNPLSWQNLLKARFDSVGINIERENDLSIFQDRDAEIKNIINNSELSISQANKNNEKRKEQIRKVLELDDHITRIIHSNYQDDDTEGLYKEFIELERFSSEIQNYVDSFDKAGNKMIDVPIHP